MIPLKAPAVIISKLEELTATVAELFPRVVTPVEDKAVKAPVPWVVAPIVVKLPAAGVVVPMAKGAAQLAL